VSFSGYGTNYFPLVFIIINDADKLNKEVNQYKDIPVVSNVTQQQVMDNYYQVKMEVKRLIGEGVERLKAMQN
jgi:hypothetical protein